MRGAEMPQPLEGSTARHVGASRMVLRLLGVLALATMLAACGRCGDFWPWGQSQIGACHSDPPRQQ